MIYQVNMIPDGIHAYLLDSEGEIDTEPGEMEIDVPVEHTENPAGLIEYVKQVVKGRQQANV